MCFTLTYYIYEINSLQPSGSCILILSKLGLNYHLKVTSVIIITGHFQIQNMTAVCPSEYLGEHIMGRLDHYNIYSELPPHLRRHLDRRVSRVCRRLHTHPGASREAVLECFSYNLSYGVVMLLALYRRRVKEGDLCLPCDSAMVSTMGAGVEVFPVMMPSGVRFTYFLGESQVQECTWLVSGSHTCQ